MKLSKKRALELVDEHKSNLIKLLNINSKKINIHVFKSNSKESKKVGVNSYKLFGCCYSSAVADVHDIVLFYDKHFSEREFVATLLHELLHVKLHKLTSYVTIKGDLANNLEEKIVRDLEKAFIKVMWK